jgi:heme/copper-type cytochrome/quinol oxidase subunit 2
MSHTYPTIPGAVPGLVCSILAWGGAFVSLVLLTMAGQNSPDGTGGIFWLLLSMPLILATVVLWLIGFIWGWIALARIRRAREQFRGRGSAWTAIVLGGLPFAIFIVSLLLLSIVAWWTNGDIRGWF